MSLVTIAVNLGLNLWLNSRHRLPGLALGTAIAANVNAGLLLFLIARRLGGGDFPRVFTTFLKTCVASAAMGVGGVLLASLAARPYSQTRALSIAPFRCSVRSRSRWRSLALSAQLLRIEEFKRRDVPPHRPAPRPKNQSDLVSIGL